MPPAPQPLSPNDAILTWVAIHQAVTERQILYRFWNLRGRSPSHGYRVLRRLVSDGLLERHATNRGAGGRSQAYVTLTRSGWKRVPVPRPTGRRPPIRLLLQLAQVALERQPDGWMFIPASDVWRLLTKTTIAAIGRDRISNHRAQDLSLIGRKTDPDLKLWALHLPQTGEVRLLVPVRTGMGLARICHRISAALYFHAEFEAINVELIVGTGTPEGAEGFVKKWFAGYRHNPRRRNKARRPRRPMQVTIRQVGLAQDLPHPSHVVRPAASIYLCSGSPGPLEAPSPSMCLATRAGGVL